MSDIERLRAVANGAAEAWGGTAWSAGEVGYDDRQGLTYDVHLGRALVAAAGCEELAEHIAVFDPPTVLALLDRLEAAEAKVARVEALADKREQQFADFTRAAEKAGLVGDHSAANWASNIASIYRADAAEHRAALSTEQDQGTREAS